MKLKILLPTEVYLEEDVKKVAAEAENGSFCLLPNHIDFVSALVPGLLFYKSEAGEEVFIAIDEGILVKCNGEVLVSTGRAIRGADLETLHQTVEKEFQRLDEREKQSRSALAKLEAGFVRGVYQMGE
jgi:F-type H+-transporting ATPase subunit epsilon